MKENILKDRELIIEMELEKLQKENEQLRTILGNQVRIKDELSEKLEKIRELVENSDWRLDDVHDLIDGYDEISKIIN